MQITGSPCSTVGARALAAHLGCEFETAEKTPCGCNVPTLIAGDFQVKHVGAILKYLSRKYGKCSGCCGKTPEEEAYVDQFVAAATRLQYLCSGLVATVFCPANIPGYNAKAHARALEMVKCNLTCINKYLLSRTFFVTERPTIADFAMFGAIVPIYGMVFTKDEVAEFGNLTRWLNTIQAIPGVSTVVPKINHAEHSVPRSPEEAKNVKPSFCHGSGAKASGNAPAAVAEEKKEDAPKANNPYANLTFDMYAWKKHYKNLDWDNKEKWEPYFFEHYNPAEYSLWKCNYYDTSKLPGEDWKVKNLITVWCQRLRGEKADKYTFGNILVTGTDDGKFHIIGVFLFPLDAVPTEVSECSGSASFVFTKLDLNKEEDKKLLTDVWYWAEESDIVHGGVVYGKTIDGETWH